MWGFIGYGATFVAIAAAAATASLLAGDAAAPAGNGTVDAIVPLVRAQNTCCRACGASERRAAQIGTDPAGFVSLLAVTSLVRLASAPRAALATSLICGAPQLAPALEEVVFRGFLLPSLTKWCAALARPAACAVR